MAEGQDPVTGRFLPGHSGVGSKRPKQNIKARITRRMLERYEFLESCGEYKSPFEFWFDVLQGAVDFSDVSVKDKLHIQLKASEYLAKYVYDHNYGNEQEQQEEIKMSPEQIAALKAAFPNFSKE